MAIINNVYNKSSQFFSLTPPPSQTETAASLNSLSNRLDTLENLNISSRLNTLESTKLDKSGGTLTGRLKFEGPYNDPVHFNNVIWGSSSASYNVADIAAYSGQDTDKIGELVFSNWSDGNRVTYLRANSDAGYGQINVQVNSSTGNISTYAPTPVITSNDNNIATTAFVNSRLPYSTGTWTPTLSGSTTAGSFTYSYTGGGKECYYVKFGNLVFLRAAFTYTITSAPAGEVRINGAPFVSNSYYDGNGGGNTRRWHLAQIGLNSSYIRPQVYKSDLSGANIPKWGSSDSLTTWLNTVNSNDWIIFSIWYKTNS